jgi:hypothetical protein
MFAQTMVDCKSSMAKRCRQVFRRSERSLLVVVPLNEHYT